MLSSRRGAKRPDDHEVVLARLALRIFSMTRSARWEWPVIIVHILTLGDGRERHQRYPFWYRAPPLVVMLGLDPSTGIFTLLVDFSSIFQSFARPRALRRKGNVSPK
jgi:hypothetical protein